MRSCISALLIVLSQLLGGVALAAPPQQPVSSQNTPAQQAVWTVFVYMNGKNNLESALATNWNQMTSLVPSSDVNVVVEMGRLGATEAWGGWSGVKRFKVKQGEQATADQALLDVGATGGNTDMGSPDTLREFLRWGISKYPAQHYMLVIWNHGQGWRFELALAQARLNLLHLSAREFHTSFGEERPPRSHVFVPDTIREFPLDVAPAEKQVDIGVSGGIRSVSNDDQTHNKLYNSDIAAVVDDVFGAQKLDVLGFDACLMAMIETAHTFRKQARYLVGSEETEGNDGWDYSRFLGGLFARPAMNPHDVAVLAVQSYRDEYADAQDPVATMSAIDLGQIDGMVGALNDLVSTLRDEKSVKAARAARAPLKTYLTWYYQPIKSSTDLGAWLTNLKAQPLDQTPKAATQKALVALGTVVVDHYASELRASAGYGSNGLAIFFPKDSPSFMADPDSPGYVVENTFKPVAFVSETQWPMFLATAFGLPTRAHAVARSAPAGRP
jgi:hypothetical protein